MTTEQIEIRELDPAEVQILGDTGPRARVDQTTVNDYAEDMAGGAEFPPITVVQEAETFWLTDGLHRLTAALSLGRDTIQAAVTLGTRADAVWQAAAANVAHGLRRSRGDKERAVRMALGCSQAVGLSNRQLAQHVGVSDYLVAAVRQAMEEAQEIPAQERLTGADGKNRPAKMAEPRDHAVDPPASPEPSSPPAEPRERKPRASSQEPADRDCLNRPITGDKAEGIAAALGRREVITLMIQTVAELKKQAKQAIERGDPLFAALNLSQFEADCMNLHNALAAIRPYAVCPYCAGNGCQACLDRGWVGKLIWDAAPRKLRG